MSETYEQYQPPAASEDGERWCVIVEFANERGDAGPPTRLDVLPTVLGSRKAAMAEAARQAFEYRPPDPYSPQHRQVFQVGDGYLVVIAGAISTFHITVRPARIVGETDQ